MVFSTVLAIANILTWENYKDFTCFKDKFDASRTFIVISCAFRPC